MNQSGKRARYVPPAFLNAFCSTNSQSGGSCSSPMSRFAHTFVNSISSVFSPRRTAPGGKRISYGAHQTVPASTPLRTTFAICPLQSPSEMTSAAASAAHVNVVRYFAVPLKYLTSGLALVVQSKRSLLVISTSPKRICHGPATVAAAGPLHGLGRRWR